MKKLLGKIIMNVADYELIWSGISSLVIYFTLDACGWGLRMFGMHKIVFYDFLTILIGITSMLFGFAGIIVGKRLKDNKVIRFGVSSIFFALSFDLIRHVGFSQDFIEKASLLQTGIEHLFMILASFLYTFIFYHLSGKVNKWFPFKKKKMVQIEKTKELISSKSISLEDEEISMLLKTFNGKIKELNEKEDKETETEVLMHTISEKVEKLIKVYQSISLGKRIEVRNDTIELIKTCIQKLESAENKEDEQRIKEIRKLKRFIEEN